MTVSPSEPSGNHSWNSMALITRRLNSILNIQKMKQKSRRVTLSAPFQQWQNLVYRVHLLGYSQSFALQNTAVCIDPFQSLPVSQIFCVLVIVVTPKNIGMQNLSSHFSPFYGEDELLMEWLRSAQRSPSLTTSSLPWANNHVSSQIHTLGVLLLQSINPVFLKAKNLYPASKLKKIKALLLGTSSVTNVEARRWPQIYCKKCVNWRWWYFPKEHLEGVNQKYCKHVSWEHTTGTLVCCAPGPLRVANPNR